MAATDAGDSYNHSSAFMKLTTIITLLLILLLAAGTAANAAPWKGYRHYYRHGYYTSYPADRENATDYRYYRYHPMYYADGCKRYCEKYDGCKRCFRHSGRGDHYEYRR